MREKNNSGEQIVYGQAVGQLRDTCDHAAAQFDGRGKLATALPELSGHLRALAGVELPDVAQVQTEATTQLAAIAQKAYVDELLGTRLVSEVFPRNTLAVNPEALKQSYDVLPVNRFRVTSGNTAADGRYRRARDEAIAGTQTDLEIVASEVPDFGVAPETITDAYVATIGSLAADVESVRQVADLYLTPIKRTFIEWVTRKAVEYKPKTNTGVTNINRRAKALNGEVSTMLADPTRYFTEAVVAALRDTYVTQGRLVATHMARKIVADNLGVLNDSLREYVGADNDTTNDYNIDSSAAPADVVSSQAATPVTNLAEYRSKQEEQRGVSEYKPLWKAELQAPWLDKDDRQRQVFRYKDGYGGELLVVSAMSRASAKVAKATINNATDKDVFDKRWQTVLSKAASAVAKGNTQALKALGTKPSELAPVYAGIPIFCDGTIQSNARRVYFALLPAKRLFDDATITTRGLDPTKAWVVAQLGLCDKDTQVELLQGFTTLSAKVLRKYNVGSI